MVRSILLAALVAACLAAAPAAQAVDLPVDVRTSVATVTAQTPVVAGTVATAANVVRPATRQVSANTSTPTVGAVGDLAEPAAAAAAAAAEYTTAAAASVIADRSHEPHAGVPVRSIRFRHLGQGRTGQSAARQGHRAALPRTFPGPPASIDVARRVSHATAASPESRPSVPDRRPPAPDGGSASAPATGLALGGLTLLGVVICMAGPRLRRRLLIQPTALRQAAFVSLLERPG
jgi:hypothetical protein